MLVLDLDHDDFPLLCVEKIKLNDAIKSKDEVIHQMRKRAEEDQSALENELNDAKLENEQLRSDLGRESTKVQSINESFDAKNKEIERISSKLTKSISKRILLSLATYANL